MGRREFGAGTLPAGVDSDNAPGLAEARTIAARRGVVLEIHDISNVYGAQVMASIRNECREGFSSDTGKISYSDQAAWYARNRGSIIARLYSVGRNNPVGYGLLRRDAAGRLVSSVAVLPEWSGRGIGAAITADIIRATRERVFATARLDNPAAVALHRDADWIRTGDDGRLAHFVTRPEIASEYNGG